MDPADNVPKPLKGSKKSGGKRKAKKRQRERRAQVVAVRERTLLLGAGALVGAAVMALVSGRR
jgi:hypothetical protein